MPCKNGCGWTAFESYATCCKKCCGPMGPHSKDCTRKNHRLIDVRRRRLLSDDVLQRENARMNQAVQEAKNAASGADMLNVLEVFVDEEWLGGYEELEGSIYRAGALGLLRRPSWIEIRESIKRPYSSAPNAKLFGSVLIWLIQIIGPTMVAVHYFLGCDRWAFSLAHWMKRPGTSLLALLFVIAFNLNALFEITKDVTSWYKIHFLFDALNCKKKRGTLATMLIIGPATRSFLYVTTCCCTTIVLGASVDDSAKDVVFDALALFFLYKLDKIGDAAEFGFVTSEDWPGTRLAWLYERMMKEQPPLPKPYSLYILQWTSYVVLLLNFGLPVFFTLTAFEIRDC